MFQHSFQEAAGRMTETLSGTASFLWSGDIAYQ